MSDSQNIIDKLKNQGLEPNLNQIKLISVLNRVDLKKRKIFKINRLKEDALDGIYIWGDVGRGKTLITKEYLSLNHDLRIKDFHYIDFMNFVHDELNNNSGSKNPLKLVTKSLCKSYDLLFIDEFQVEDVADAMIIGDLLNKIVDKGIKIILTSNAHPSDLYKDGLQRQKFIKSMNIFSDKIKIFKLEGDVDYRTKNLIELNKKDTGSSYSEKEIFNVIKNNFGIDFIKNEIIEINNRKFKCKIALKNLLWIEFNSFFQQPLGTSDYKFISQQFDWVFISKFNICNDEKIDLVRRFISFIDIAYVEKVKVKFFFNKVKEKDIYSGDRLEILWRRCQSRLMEMQTFEYLDK
tara:strand:+ start:3380 stop:4429 length:1050 start_codon:yes stop_codon:yes gene_type:complete